MRQFTKHERELRAALRALIEAVEAVTWVDSRGDRYVSYMEDVAINGDVDEPLDAAKALLKPRSK